MILGISFLEAPLKFQAPNMTLVLGLGVGKLVFSALNKVEIVFSIILTAYLIKQFTSLERTTLFVLFGLILLLVLQSIWLIPILNARVDSLLNGIEVPSTNHHFYYVGLEFLKVILLISGFIKIYKN